VIAHSHAKRNPATDIRPRDILRASLKSNYARIDAKELPNLLRQMEIYQGTHVTRFAMKLMALTFIRTSELIGAKWSEFDLEAARWNIPAERMKMRTPHIVPLATQSLEVLNLLWALPGHSEWLFPGDRNAAKPISNNTILQALKRMGYQGRMTGDCPIRLNRRTVGATLGPSADRAGAVLPLINSYAADAFGECPREEQLQASV
jgi:integrase